MTTTTRRSSLPAALASLLVATLITAGCNTTDSPRPAAQTASGSTASADVAPLQAIPPTLGTATTIDTRSTAEKIASLQALPRHERTAAAARIGLTEAHLLAADVTKNVIRLKDGPETARAILLRLHELGRIRATARNDEVTLSVTGTARPPRLIPATEEREARTFPGYFGPPIDLRPNFAQWQFTLAQITFTREGQVRRSLNFFDAQGRAVQRLYIDTLDGIPAFEQILQDYRADTQSTEITLRPEDPDERAPQRADAQVDTSGLLAAWDAMTDVHEFSGILAKYDVTRLQALRLAGPTRALRLDAPAALRALLSAAAEQELEIMAFVSNSANTQIFTGQITEPSNSRGGWLRVGDDKGFSLLVRETGIDQIWLVKKPSRVGTLSTVEVYNDKGEVIVQFYSRREPRKSESDTWRSLLDALPKKS